jgi:hypothetical protein
MTAVPIGGFHEKPPGGRARAGRRVKWIPGSTQVSAEEERIPRLILEPDHGRTQEVPRRKELELKVLGLEGAVPLPALEKLASRLRIVTCEEGKGRAMTGKTLPIRERGILLLEVRSVLEENGKQVSRGRGHEDRALVPRSHQCGKVPGVIQMGVAEHHCVEGARWNGEGFPILETKGLETLKETTLHEETVPRGLDQKP